MIRSGLIDIGINNLRRAGLGGYAWSLRANSGMDFAHNLDFNASSVGASYSNVRFDGFPLQIFLTKNPAAGRRFRHK